MKCIRREKNSCLYLSVRISRLGKRHDDPSLAYMCHVIDFRVLFSIKAQEDAAAQIQEMFSFITEEEESYSEKGS